MDKSVIIESLDREIEFYRKHQIQTYYAAIIANAFVLSGQSFITVDNPVLLKILSTCFFILVAILSVALSRSFSFYKKQLRDARASILKECGLDKLNINAKRAPRIYYEMIIILFSAIGVILPWIGAELSTAH